MLVNVFLLSPGRTATTTLSIALNEVADYTSSHESRVNELGSERISYPENHIECDNRLTWFLPRLTPKYKDKGILVVIKRDVKSIAKSYNQRWQRIYMMKAYSQGILLRDLKDNNLDVCEDYVNNVYEQISYHSIAWKNVIEIDLKDPSKGIYELLQKMNRLEYFDNVMRKLNETHVNLNNSVFKNKKTSIKFNLKCLIWDLFH